jgi:hypothetical protein
LVIRVSREPAENTSTSPLGSAVAELEGEELAELEELEEELLQPAAASPKQERTINAATGAPRR